MLSIPVLGILDAAYRPIATFVKVLIINTAVSKVGIISIAALLIRMKSLAPYDPYVRLNN